MEYKVYNIFNGQYEVEINLASCLTANKLQNLKNSLIDISRNDDFFKKIYSLNNNILKYKSETIVPVNRDPKKQNVLLIFGNPATHSIKYGMFFFSKSNDHRHPMWKKLHDAKLVKLIDYSHLKDKSFLEIRGLEANEKKEIIKKGMSSDKYLVGLTTFYSFPTPVKSGYKYSNVKGVERVFGNILSYINSMEIERIIGYEFAKNAIFVFVQKSSYCVFKKESKQINNKIIKKCIYWPAVCRKKNALNKGTDLAKMLAQ